MPPKKQLFKLFGLFALPCLGISACGILGNKEAANKTVAMNQNTGCLDELGPLVGSFFKGEADPGVWRQSWTCVDDTLETFTQYVAGSTPGGYTPEDVQILITRFIITGKPISPEFLKGLFALKTTLFGGNEQVLSRTEIQRFRKLARFLRDESTVLIPEIWNFRNSPTPAKLSRFVGVAENFGQKLFDQLQIDSYPALDREKLISFLIELSKFDVPMSPKQAREWVEFATEIKVFLFRGEPTRIAANEMREVLRLAFRLGSRMLSIGSLDERDVGFQLETATYMREELLRTINRWNGGIPYTSFERIIDGLPSELLPAARGTDVKNGLKSLLQPHTTTVAGKSTTRPPTFARLFPTTDQNSFRAENVESLYKLFREAAQSEVFINQLFSSLNRELTPAEFESAARSASYAPDKAIVDRLVRSANIHPGWFSEDSARIRFTNQRGTHSRNNLVKLSWFELISKKLLDGYGSSLDERGIPRGTIDDLQTLVLDIEPLLGALGFLHPDAVDTHKKRFREANIFMPASDGDAYLSLEEITEYILTIMSAADFAAQIETDGFRNGVKDGPTCPVVGIDPKINEKEYDIHCFRDNFRRNFSQTFALFPGLLDTIAQHTPAEVDKFFESIEYAGKWTGFNNDPIDAFDLTTYSGLAQYVETVMTKFDQGGGRSDGVLDRSEVMSRVYPLFERELESLSGIRIRVANQALLLYLMQYGAIPFACPSKPKLGEITDLIGWLMRGGPWKNFRADRFQVYNIFGALTAMGGTCATTASPEELYPGSNPYVEMIPHLPADLN